MDDIRRTKVRMLRRFLEKIEQEIRIVLSEEESKFKTDRAKRELEEAESEIADFSSQNEHYETVKDRMADLIDMNARRMQSLPAGQRVALSLQEAYRIACLSDPELASSVMRQR